MNTLLHTQYKIFSIFFSFCRRQANIFRHARCTHKAELKDITTGRSSKNIHTNVCVNRSPPDWSDNRGTQRFGLVCKSYESANKFHPFAAYLRSLRFLEISASPVRCGLQEAPAEVQDFTSISGNTDMSNPQLLKAKTALLFALNLTSVNTGEPNHAARAEAVVSYGLWIHNGHIILRQVVW